MKRITSSIDISEEAGVRFLHFGSDWVQGAMRIARPWSLELQYTREMMMGLLLRQDSGWPRRVLLIGLGAGSLAKFLYRHFPDAKLKVVEIDPSVVTVARQFFKLPEDPERLQVEICDGAVYVANTRRRYDLILVDGFDADARAGALDTEPFYQLCRTRLSENGVLVSNLLGKSRGFKGSVERLRRSFDGRATVFPSADSGNAIALAARGDAIRIRLEELKQGAQRLKEGTGLNLLPTLARLTGWQSCPGGYLEL